MVKAVLNHVSYCVITITARTTLSYYVVIFCVFNSSAGDIGIFHFSSSDLAVRPVAHL